MKKYVRKAVLDLKAYEVNDAVYSIKLDANEGIDWYDGLNRYPDNQAVKLIKALSSVTGKKENELIVGNGSSELIELILKTFLEPQEYVVSIDPTFSMYKIFTTIYNGKYKGYKLVDNQYCDTEDFIKFIGKTKAKIVIISNPNNPTGSFIEKESIEKILEGSDAIVVIDEAYIEFAKGSVIDLINKYENLIVLRTFSKAYAVAGIRLGYLAANESIVKYIKRVKSPYNLNAISQEIGLKALENIEGVNKNIKLIKEEREKVWKVLDKLGLNPIPSYANFILFQGEDKLNDYLESFGILVREFEGDLKGYIRLTVGTREENDKVIEKIRRYCDEKCKN
ncbi:MAG: histidinol-phosphate transaminase [Bacillota bacterium]|nr:histidinol-phosphate transaminase [Bacillota bacterium]